MRYAQLYLSKTYHEKNALYQGERVHLFLCRAEKKTPFLRIAEVVVGLRDRNMELDHTLKTINDEILAECENPKIHIISLHTGVLCPVKVNDRETLYSGISNSPNNIPVHQTFLSFDPNGVILMNKLHDPISPSEVMLFRPVDNHSNICRFLEDRLESLI